MTHEVSLPLLIAFVIFGVAITAGVAGVLGGLGPAITGAVLAAIGGGLAAWLFRPRRHHDHEGEP